ncbi:MAG: C25 family cysteine peptidase, partial [Fidelibacterota bacterium]
MKNTTWIISVIIITGLFAGKSHRFQIIEKNSLNTKIHFSQEDLTFKNVQEFQEIKSKSYSTTTEPGMPQLPTHHFLFEIDPNSNFQVTFDILSSHTEHGINIKPYQPVILGDTMNDASGPIIDQSFYNSTQIYPSENLIVSDPQILRDLQVVSIGLIPFRYIPRDRTLEVFDEVEIKISVESDDQQFQSNRISKSFTSVYQSSILNYNNSREVSETPVILYICGGNSQNSPYLQSLFSWRHQRGFKVNSVPTSITGTSSSAIKNYIQNQYDNPATRPDFVCLVGDVGGSYNIPTFTESNSGYGGEGDHPYSQLSGNDLLSDVFIGRLPVRSLTDIGVVVNKIINYEKGYDLSSNWTEKAALIGDPTSSGISCTITKEFVADIMEEYGMEDVRLKTSGGSWSNWMQNQLNEGVLYFNYRGYYGTSGFNSSNINNANNGFKLPFTTVITCGTGSFSSESVALSEKFMVAGTMSNPKGGIAAIGTATLGTHTLFNNIFDMGIYQGLFPGGCETAGEALVSGKFYLYENYPSNPNNYVSIFTHWNNLMGDPATHLWTDTPKDFVVTHPETLNWGENLISVTVETADGVPVENARITLLKGSDEIFSNSFSDENGFVQIPVDFQTSGEINITVTKRNMVPYIGIITIPFSGPNLTINELEFLIIDDGTGNTDGNGDSIINPGETFIVSIPVYNAGTDGISGIDCELSFLSNSVEVISGVDTISYLPGNNHSDTVEFICQISASAEDHQLLDGYLTIITEDLNTWQFYVPLNVVGAHLDIHDISVAGNEGGFLTPGQTDTLWIALENDGSLPANSLTGNLSSQENLITIDEFEATWIGINSEESEYSENPFVISVSENVIYGSVINFTLQLQSDNGFEKQIIFQILAGEQSVNDPLGPDLHGYYIYDSGDTGYDLAPVYNWIEIDPDLGGSGTALSINDNGNTGDSQIINLPFNFRFYGEDYTQLTVCSNGWIAPGSSPMESFRNYTIPGAGGPSPMIAVFWDDLTTNNGGEIYTYYDEAQGIFIIEWSALRTFNHNSLETFQAILYDNMMPPFGDNEIKLQYKDFNNTSDGSYYQAIHGDYCTVGLEDQTATIGLQYTFNNGYAIPAMTLNDESALFITTRQAQSVPTPELTLEQPDFQFELAPDQWDQEVLTISNGGEAGSILYYGFELLPLPFPGGHPDDFGHFWSDSQIDPTIDNTW